MQPIARSILVLHPSAVFVERIRAAAGRAVSVHAVASWDTLAAALPTAPAATTVVVDPYADVAEGEPPRLAEALRTLTVSFPSVPVLAAVTPTPETVGHLRTLARWGVTELIQVDHDEPAAIRIRLRQAQAAPLKAALDSVLPPGLSGRTRTMLDHVADAVLAGGQGKHLARELGMSRRTLLRWSERAELPAPRPLMAWMRILLAALLLDDPGRTIRSAALACGYSADSGLRRVTDRFLGLSPSELRDRGAFAAASKGFVRALAELRAERKAPGAPAPVSLA